MLFFYTKENFYVLKALQAPESLVGYELGWSRHQIQ